MSRVLGRVLACGVALAAFAPFSAGWAQPDLPRVILNAAEQAWLDAHPDIRLAVDIDWAPFEYVDDQKRYRGMAADHIALVEQRLGIRFQIDKERPWPKMVDAVRNRDLDAFSLVVQTPQRDEYVNFTRPYISFPMVIFTREDEAFLDGVEGLRSRTVAVVESYASHELLSKNHPHLKLAPSENVKSGLEAVVTGRADAFVGNLAVATQVIREAGLTNLKISGQTPYRFELRMAVRNDWPELVPILQKGLDSITPEERDQIYNRWIRLKFDEQTDLRLIAVVIGVGVFLLAVFAFWNRKLQREVQNRLQAERELDRERQRLQEIIWGTNVGTWEWNVQTGETHFNERWAEIIGYTLEELEPLSIETWINAAHPNDLKRSKEQLEKNFSGELERYECEVRMRHKNGHWVWVADRGKVVEWTADGQPLRMSGTHADITGRKNLDRMKSEFVSTVSHELRTPLTSIKGALGLVTGGALGDLPKRAREMIDVAHKNTERLILLVNDILDMEKLDSDQVEFEFRPLNLSELVKDAVETNLGYAQEHRVRFVVKTLAPDARVLGDSHRLTQAVTNLLSNAAKFSPDGGHVDIAVSCQDNVAQVSVRDHGEGIPEEFKDHIFERFAQSDAADNREKGGTGLGLSITKQIVEKHGGVIHFESQHGVGSTFSFSLPVCA